MASRKNRRGQRDRFSLGELCIAGDRTNGYVVLIDVCGNYWGIGPQHRTKREALPLLRRVRKILNGYLTYKASEALVNVACRAVELASDQIAALSTAAKDQWVEALRERLGTRKTELEGI